MWTEEDFERRVGRLPQIDDLDRTNCLEAGSSGHLQCGICEHDMPVFLCLVCIVKPFNKVKREKD